MSKEIGNTEKFYKEEYDRVGEHIRKVCSDTGWILNPDRGVAEKVHNGLARNLVRYKKMYCPCCIIRQDCNNDDKICPCSGAKEQIASAGSCRCRLFFSGNENDTARKD